MHLNYIKMGSKHWCRYTSEDCRAASVNCSCRNTVGIQMQLCLERNCFRHVFICVSAAIRTYRHYLSACSVRPDGNLTFMCVCMFVSVAYTHLVSLGCFGFQFVGQSNLDILYSGALFHLLLHSLDRTNFSCHSFSSTAL